MRRAAARVLGERITKHYEHDFATIDATARNLAIYVYDLDYDGGTAATQALEQAAAAMAVYEPARLGDARQLEW